MKKNILSQNDEAYKRWKANGGDNQFVAIIDGDDVASGKDFNKVAIDAGDLVLQRGKEANLTIYDSSTDAKIPH